MNKIIVKGIFLGLLVGCQPQTEVPTQVGHLIAISPLWQYLDVEKIKNIEEFDAAYEEQTKLKGNFRFILPYNFEKKQIAANQSEQRGIPIMGIPYECYIYCCKYRDILIEVDHNQKHQIEFEPVDKASLKKWIALQLLNNGQDPALSDNPHQAIFRVTFDKEQPFTDANALLYQIVEAYEEFLQERARVEQIDVKQAKDSYPLTIRFARKPPPVPPQPIIIEEELEQLEVELNPNE